MNKLTIVILGTILATAITPVLASAESWPQIDRSFYCLAKEPEPGGTYSTEILKAHFDCLTAQTIALKTWIDTILAQLPLPTQFPQPSPPPRQTIKEIPVRAQIEPIGPSVTQVGWAGGDAVMVIQNFLKAEGSFTYPQATGYFGPITEQAVKTFQTKYGLPPTGIVDLQTVTKMESVSSQVAPTLKSRINDLKPTSRP